MNKKIIVLIDQAVNSLFAFILNIILIKSLGFEWFGLYSQYQIAILIVGSLFYSSLFSHILLNYQIMQFERRNTYILSILIVFCLFLVLSVILFFLFLLLKGEGYDIFFSYFLYGLSYLLIEFVRKILFADGRYKDLLKINIYIIFFTSAYLFLITDKILKPTIHEYFISISIITFSLIVINFIGSILRFFKFIQISLEELSVNIENIISYSKWTIPSTVCGWFGESFLLLAYGWLKGPEALGGIRGIQTITSILNPALIISENLSTTIYSKLAIDGDENKLHSRVKMDLIFASVLTIIISILALIFGNWLIEVLLKTRDEGQDVYLATYILVYIFLFAASFYRSFARATNNPKIILYASLAGMIFSISTYHKLLAYGQWGFLASLSMYYLMYVAVLVFMCKPETKK